MPTPQPGIFAERTHSHMLLEYQLKDGVDDASLCRALGRYWSVFALRLSTRSITRSGKGSSNRS